MSARRDPMHMQCGHTLQCQCGPDRSKKSLWPALSLFHCSVHLSKHLNGCYVLGCKLIKGFSLQPFHCGYRELEMCTWSFSVGHPHPPHTGTYHHHKLYCNTLFLRATEHAHLTLVRSNYVSILSIGQMLGQNSGLMSRHEF